MKEDIRNRIARIRLINQQFHSTQFKTPHELVAWMGAMQAQDYNMAKWAIGTRLHKVSDKQVEESVNKGEIIRTHILRPTWHFVSNRNIRWMMKLTAPRIKSVARHYDKVLGISPETFLKTTPIIVQALEKNGSMTRVELSQYIKEAGYTTENNWMAHYAMHAELDGLICSGIVRGKHQTYRLLDEIVPSDDDYDRDEALSKLASIYFQSHSPATLQDFVWWSGLTATDCKKAIGMIKSDYIEELVDGEVYYFPRNIPDVIKIENLLHFIPSWDEYLVSYKNRKHVLVDEHYARIISSKNGLFKPAISLNGEIIGEWSRKVSGKKTSVETNLFYDQGENVNKLIETEMERLKEFLLD